MLFSSIFSLLAESRSRLQLFVILVLFLFSPPSFFFSHPFHIFTSLTTSFSLSPDRTQDIDVDRHSCLRQGRPSLQTRQSSYSKRHASFDSPREVPLPVHPPLSQRFPPASDTRDFRLPYQRTSSDSSCPRSPSLAPYDVVHPVQPDHESLSSTARTSEQEDIISTASSASAVGLSRLPSPSTRSAADDDMSESPENSMQMTYAHDEDQIDDAGPSSDRPRNTTESYHREQRNAGIWDSSHLRPELLASPKARIRDIASHQISSNHHNSLPPPGSPYFLHNQEHCEVYAPSPTRPSSAASLPLPSQMPFYALPTSAPIQHQQVSNSGTGLQSVIEQVPSDFSNQSHDTETSGSDSYSFSSHSHYSQEYNRSPQGHSPTPPTSNLAALFESTDRLGRRNARISAAGSTSTVSTVLSASSQASSASSSLPPPTPPMVHSPPPPPFSEEDETDGNRENASRDGKRRSAPYEPFLSHAPPPADAYITVETTDVEYRLIVRLPGYRRDCMYVSFLDFVYFEFD